MFSTGNNSKRGGMVKKGSGVSLQEDDLTVSSHTTTSYNGSGRALTANTAPPSSKARPSPRRRSLLRRHSGNQGSIFGGKNNKSGGLKAKKLHKKRGQFHQDAAVDFTARGGGGGDDDNSSYNTLDKLDYSIFDHERYDSDDDLFLVETTPGNALTLTMNNNSNTNLGQTLALLTVQLHQFEDHAQILKQEILHYAETHLTPQRDAYHRASVVHWDRAHARWAAQNYKGAQLSLRKLQQTQDEQLPPIQKALDYLTQDLLPQINQQVARAQAAAGGLKGVKHDNNNNNNETFDLNAYRNYRRRCETIRLEASKEILQASAAAAEETSKNSNIKPDPKVLEQELETWAPRLGVEMNKESSKKTQDEGAATTETKQMANQETPSKQILEI